MHSIPPDPIKSIQNTSKDALISKKSLVTKGYLQDPFIDSFLQKPFATRSPVINRGYYVRLKAVDTLLQTFSSIYQNSQRQVVSFGCGLDTNFFRLTNEAPDTFSNYVEIDYPKICKEKSLCIKKSAKIKNLLKGKIKFNDDGNVLSDNYQLMGCDLNDIKQLENIFNYIDTAIPTLFLSECSLVYLDPKNSNNVIKSTAEIFSSDIFFVLYEQIKVNVRFCDVMVENLKKRGIILKSLDEYSSLKAMEERFLSLGYSEASAKDMNYICYEFLGKDFIKVCDGVEMLDELEEIHLMQANYCILVASRYGGASKEKKFKNLGMAE